MHTETDSENVCLNMGDMLACAYIHGRRSQRNMKPIENIFTLCERLMSQQIVKTLYTLAQEGDPDCKDILSTIERAYMTGRESELSNNVVWFDKSH